MKLDRPAAALALAVALSADSALAQSITEKQADEILKELRQIRQLLERQVQAMPAPAAPPPGPAADERVTVPSPTGPVLGKPDAPVTIIEYTDLECPFCHQFHMNAFADIKKSYIDTGKVRFISRDFPLGFHPHAKSAAVASRCAGEQGKFWELRNLLAANADKLAPEAVTSYAREVKLDLEAFQDCLAGDRFASALQKDWDDAIAAGVSGTPTFVIARTAPGATLQGTRVVGAQPFEAFEQRIRALLEPPAAP